MSFLRKILRGLYDQLGTTGLVVGVVFVAFFVVLAASWHQWWMVPAITFIVYVKGRDRHLEELAEQKQDRARAVQMDAQRRARAVLRELDGQGKDLRDATPQQVAVLRKGLDA